VTAGARNITALLVSYNSQAVLSRAVSALQAGTQPPDSVVVVDNASSDPTYLDELVEAHPAVDVVRLSTNAGYCVGNNLGIERIARHNDVLLLNPDAFVSRTFLEQAGALLDRDPSIGAVGPKLLGADQADGEPTGRIDSGGIFQTRWGRFYDRGQGAPDRGQCGEVDLDVTALCAAAVLIRREALDDVTRSSPLFDPRFVMYKEDLDLSFRLRRVGWRTVYDGSLEVLHCRGWNPDRHAMPAWTRRRSLVNEWRLWRRGWTPERGRLGALPYLVAKSLAVAVGR
jgi:N-acetylglucosaminyl-diphospho-decaprenol L-rhamnosyltransferase